MAYSYTSSSLSDASLEISEFMALMCDTAWTTSPVPGSPLVLIIDAPSEILLRASPRFLAPHTNGTLNLVLSIWCTSSAGDRTSLSSM